MGQSSPHQCKTCKASLKLDQTLPMYTPNNLAAIPYTFVSLVALLALMRRGTINSLLLLLLVGVATSIMMNMCLLWQNFCCNKNDTYGSTRQWYIRMKVCVYYNIYVTVCFSITARTCTLQMLISFFVSERQLLLIKLCQQHRGPKPERGSGREWAIWCHTLFVSTDSSFMAPSQAMEDTLKQLSKEIITPKFAAIKHSCSTALSECSVLISMQRVISFMVTGSRGDIYTGCLGCHVILYVVVVV